jgi:hypothetical protein
MAYCVRANITPKVVANAVRLASRAKDSKDIHDWFDLKQRYLQLRQRGRRVSWLVRAKGRSQKIGSAIRGHRDPDYMDLIEARQRAGEVYFAMPPKSALKLSSRPGWTWSELDRQYQVSLAGKRLVGKKIKRPVPSTQDDVRLCFNTSPSSRTGRRSDLWISGPCT